MTHKRSVVLAALGFILIATAAAARAQGAPSDSVLKGFQPSGDYVLVVNGKPVPAAEIYQNELPAILVLSSALPSPVLVTPRAGSVETVHIMKVAKQKDGSVDLLADAVLASIGQFEQQGENALFNYEGRKVSLNAKPALTGLHPGADLKAHNPQYARSASVYKPNGVAIASLKKDPVPVTVRVFFGSWCSHCLHLVPHILRVEDELKGSKIRFVYFGLQKAPDGWKDPEVKRLGVRGIPTGIVYKNGKEIGRIVGEEWTAPEVQLNKIVHGQAAQGGK